MNQTIIKTFICFNILLCFNQHIKADPEDYDVPSHGDYDGMQMPDPEEDFKKTEEPKNKLPNYNQSIPYPYMYNNPYIGGYAYPPMIIQNFNSGPQIQNDVPSTNHNETYMNRQNGFNAPLPPGQGFNAKPVIHDSDSK